MDSSTVHQKIVEIICNNCPIDPNSITREAHFFKDLGIDSLDFLDLTFEIDKAFEIKLPVREWFEEIEAKGSLSTDYFVMGSFADYVSGLVNGSEACATTSSA